MNELNAAIRDIPLPSRMERLPISDKGFVVPHFVSWLDADNKPMPRGQGTPDFRCIQPGTVANCHSRKQCWLCGQPLGAYKAFVIGPMCAINRISAEPPSHLECAQYAVKACPFLTKPKMRRNAEGLPEDKFTQEGFIDRNPGVALIWVTKSYQPLKTSTGMLFQIGDPVTCEWYTEGRMATRAEVLASIESGLPLLTAEAEKQGRAALSALPRQVNQAMKLVPA